MYTLTYKHSWRIAVLFKNTSESHESADIIDTREIATESNKNIVDSFHELILDPEFLQALQNKIAQMPTSSESYKLTLALNGIMNYDERHESIHTNIHNDLIALQNTLTA